MNISNEEVEHVATLARLGIDETEKELFSLQLSQILTSFDTLKHLEPQTQSSLCSGSMYEPFREDEIVPSLSRDQALLNAPEAEAGHFQVPKIMD